ncbi:MAG: ABC transporter ATP-binding protein [Deltaproteobacteria bacterium]|nr:ABC transporter ATP-binding protein [Deltaproteobacteria bacterium]
MFGEEVVFKLKDVGFSYPSGEKALEGINLSVRRGEKVALLGANGSGKSTLLKLLNGLLFTREGTIEALGQVLSEKIMANEEFSFAFRRRVGFVFQKADAQLFNSNVREEIAFGPVQLGWPAAEVNRVVDDVISMLNLDRLRDRPPFRLSGGEKRLVALASVLSLNPDVLLLDEPTSGLDPRTQRRLIRLIQQLNEAGKTIIVATHNLEILQEIADRAIVFSEDHHLVAEGPCEQVLSNIDLLVQVNLVDEEFHLHHPHPHGGHAPRPVTVPPFNGKKAGFFTKP